MITLDPKRISTPSGGAGKAADRRRARPGDEQAKLPPAPRAEVNFIPEPESLRTLIANALVALRRGVRWDRGSILNLLA